MLNFTLKKLQFDKIQTVSIINFLYNILINIWKYLLTIGKKIKETLEEMLKKFTSGSTQVCAWGVRPLHNSMKYETWKLRALKCVIQVYIRVDIYVYIPDVRYCGNVKCVYERGRQQEATSLK